MINPFTHTAKGIAGFYRDAYNSDCAPGPSIVGVTLIAPIAIPTLFISAFFEKGKKP